MPWIHRELAQMQIQENHILVEREGLLYLTLDQHFNKDKQEEVLSEMEQMLKKQIMDQEFLLLEKPNLLEDHQLRLMKKVEKLEWQLKEKLKY